MQHLPTPATVAAARRHARAARLAARILDLFAAGVTDCNLRQRLLSGEPYDLDRGPDGFALRLYGLETPLMKSETAALLAWAGMALGQPARTGERTLA